MQKRGTVYVHKQFAIVFIPPDDFPFIVVPVISVEVSVYRRISGNFLKFLIVPSDNT